MNEITRRRSTFANNPFNAPDGSALPDNNSPLRLAIHDAALNIRRLPLLPLNFWPFFTNNPENEFCLRKWSNIVSIFRQVFLFCYTIVVFALLGCILVFGVFAYFPPQGFALGLLATFLLTIGWFVLTRPLTYISSSGTKFPHESWLFVNGAFIDSGWLKLNCEMLAKMFGRRIVGIHNRTFGPVFDGLECMIQRDFGYTTDAVRQLYAVMKRELLDRDNHRVVLISHSQGGVIASMVVDHLLATLGESPLRRLEVYTFGSAVNHMNGGGILKHIEHFANKYDFGAQTGVLAYEPLTKPGNKYDGEVYTDLEATGHFLNMHYLGTTFAKGRPATSSRMNRYLNGGMRGNFS